MPGRVWPRMNHGARQIIMERNNFYPNFSLRRKFDYLDLLRDNPWPIFEANFRFIHRLLLQKQGFNAIFFLIRLFFRRKLDWPPEEKKDTKLKISECVKLKRSKRTNNKKIIIKTTFTQVIKSSITFLRSILQCTFEDIVQCDLWIKHPKFSPIVN